MKILKVKIKRTQTEKGTHYDYPDEYDASKILVLCYESHLKENYDAVVARGNKDEFLIGAVQDEDAPAFVKSPDIVEITQTEAEQLGGQWTRQVEKIIDQGRVIAVCKKILAGTPLTQEDKDAIDPDKPAFGINRTKPFAETLSECLAMPRRR